MNIGSGNSYPSNALSNFSPHKFTIDGVECNSMEGFLQSLKFKSPEMQAHVCTLVGKAAKFKGKKKNWRTTQTLYWKGIPISRRSEGYKTLIENAFTAMMLCSDSFRRALKASGNCTFEHSIGRTSESETVLTVNEFCSNLYRVRDLLNGKNNPKKDS